VIESVVSVAPVRTVVRRSRRRALPSARTRPRRDEIEQVTVALPLAWSATLPASVRPGTSAAVAQLSGDAPVPARG